MARRLRDNFADEERTLVQGGARLAKPNRRLCISLVHDVPESLDLVRQSLACGSCRWLLTSHTNAKEALREIPLAKPSAILVDLANPVLTAHDFTIRIKLLLPAVPVVVLSTAESEQEVARHIAAGAQGCLLKPMDPEEIERALIRAIAGLPALCLRAQRLLFGGAGRRGASTSGTPGAALTHSEEDVLACLAKGFSDKEVARALRIVGRTVNVHKTRIYRKLGVHTRSQAISKYLAARQ
jgi:DNA-binding NarL/FixJ family response regulator